MIKSGRVCDVDRSRSEHHQRAKNADFLAAVCLRVCRSVWWIVSSKCATSVAAATPALNLTSVRTSYATFTETHADELTATFVKRVDRRASRSLIGPDRKFCSLGVGPTVLALVERNLLDDGSGTIAYFPKLRSD